MEQFRQKFRILHDRLVSTPKSDWHAYVPYAASLIKVWGSEQGGSLSHFLDFFDNHVTPQVKVFINENIEIHKVLNGDLQYTNESDFPFAKKVKAPKQLKEHDSKGFFESLKEINRERKSGPSDEELTPYYAGYHDLHSGYGSPKPAKKVVLKARASSVVRTEASTLVRMLNEAFGENESFKDLWCNRQLGMNYQAVKERRADYLLTYDAEGDDDLLKRAAVRRKLTTSNIEDGIQPTSSIKVNWGGVFEDNTIGELEQSKVAPGGYIVSCDPDGRMMFYHPSTPVNSFKEEDTSLEDPMIDEDYEEADEDSDEETL